LLTGLDHSELLAENLFAKTFEPDPAVVLELTHLAMTHEELPFLAAEMFELLRKTSGQPSAVVYLGTIQYLASTGTPAGARLLAAFLNVSIPGERLVPAVQALDSSRRYWSTITGNPQGQGPFQSDWLNRFQRISIEAQQLGQKLGLPVVAPTVNDPRRQQPWLMLRDMFGYLLAKSQGEEFWEEDSGPALLTDFLRLEIDAWQERISNLAGNINPFRMESVARVLPILNRADAEIRDLRQMTSWVAERDFESAFVRPVPRWRESFDDKDWFHLLNDLDKSDELAGLKRLARGLGERPILISQLCAGVQMVINVSVALVAEGVRDRPLDLLTACVLVQSHYGNGQVVFALEAELADTLGALIPPTDDTEHPLYGLAVMSGLLIIDLPAELQAGPHGLPNTRVFTVAEDMALQGWRDEHQKLDTSDLEAMREQALSLARLIEGDDEDDLEDVEDMGASALKQLVMANIQSVSVLLGFLRNPRMTAIPGLVEEVVNRTRNPRIIATIASDRTLHKGFANKGVAVACLRSPVNVSVKVLRKFCHVKYVSKVELKRMAADRTGIRKEVAREIKKYLDALA